MSGRLPAGAVAGSDFVKTLIFDFYPFTEPCEARLLSPRSVLGICPIIIVASARNCRLQAAEG